MPLTEREMVARAPRPALQLDKRAGNGCKSPCARRYSWSKEVERETISSSCVPT